MYLENIIKTILSKAGIILLNFAIVILTTQFWGAEGRGIIALLMADMAIIVIFNNVFSGGSISYHTPRAEFSRLIIPAYIWIILISIVSSLMFFVFLNNINVLFLIGLSITTSLASFNLAVFVGKEKLSQYNFYNFLIPLLTLIFTLAGNFFFPKISINCYFWGYGFAYLIVWAASIIYLRPNFHTQKPTDFKLIKNVFVYGFKNESSYFLQFLNYRFSYFIIFHYIGIKQVGIFSIGIAIAESVWIISKSLSLVQYSKIINAKDPQATITQTNLLAIISTLATIFIGIIIVFLPANWFGFIFGKDFTDVKQIALLLYPGIIFLAFSNIYAHHLTATGQMWPIFLKTLYGLVTTILLSYLLIPKLGITGACITTSTSHFISALYTYIAFRSHIKKYSPVASNS
jgi:O-antigen/teichoic acid export membrane protein